MKAVVAGHICLDIIPELESPVGLTPDQFFLPGQMMSAEKVTISTGGTVSNTGLNLAKLGVDVSLMSKVGDDAFGKLVQNHLAAYDVDLRLSVDASSMTSYTVVLAPKGLDRMFLHAPGANRTFNPGDIDFDCVAEADLFHFGYPPLMDRMIAEDGRNLADMLAAVKQTGVTTCMDAAMPDPARDSTDWHQIFRKCGPHLDIYTPSIEETLFMLDREAYLELRQTVRGDFVEAVDHSLLHRLSGMLLDFGIRIVVLKCGTRGWYLRTGEDAGKGLGKASPADLTSFADREFIMPAVRENVFAGATGAGDASIAGFIAALMRGMSLDDCAKAAVCAGACNVEKPDALSGMPTWDGLMERFREVGK